MIRLGQPGDVVPAFVREVRGSILVGDENPVRVAQEWRQQVARAVAVPFQLVDADVIVPTSLFPKEEYAARTIRPKIHRVLADYLKPLPSPETRTAWKGSVPPVK